MLLFGWFFDELDVDFNIGWLLCGLLYEFECVDVCVCDFVVEMDLCIVMEMLFEWECVYGLFDVCVLVLLLLMVGCCVVIVFKVVM